MTNKTNEMIKQLEDQLAERTAAWKEVAAWTTSDRDLTLDALDVEINFILQDLQDLADEVLA